MSDLVLFWHRNDLRISDSTGLARASQTDARIIGVFCLDPAIIDRDDVAPARMEFLIGSLNCLAEDYRRSGNQLLILHQDPTVGIPQLASGLQVKSVYWHLDVEPYSQIRDARVTEALKQHGIAAQPEWDRVLHDPTQIKTGNNQPYSVYTPYWRNWIGRSKPAPAEVKLRSAELTPTEQQALTQLPVIELPTAKDLGFIWDKPLILEPGTSAAEQRLAEFCDRAVSEYDERRNYPGVAGTSRLSAALKFGTIGIRTVWAATATAMAEASSDEVRHAITVWQQELAWREFYQQAMYHFPSLAEGPYRAQLKNFPWQNDEKLFSTWCQGKTGYPIVDAAMRQLNEAGWMHNRCRMIVASFLTKDLIIDWRWGEKYFMQHLTDGDLSANNGGWQWSASSGMDPKPLRIFNPYTQAQKFDPEGDYIRHWVPELKSEDTKDILSGKILPLDRQRLGYPLPIVDHNEQQRLFKQLYSSIKGGAVEANEL
jgi:deoxyribodipyrimidine photo-lyase